MSRELFSLLQSEERLFALLEPGGALHARWGRQQTADSGEGLRFRKFHHPRRKDPSFWTDFEDSASWHFSEGCRFLPENMREEAPLPPPAAQRESDRPGWNLLCEKAADAIRNERAHKLVPARHVSYHLTPPEHAAILRGLPARLFPPPMANAYRFLLRSRESVFFGATPELLFRREGGLITVPAIAGTRPLSEGAVESSLGQELLASEKDRAEHEWVVTGIADALKKIGLSPTFPSEPVVLRVPRLLHLYTPITASDIASVPSETLLDALHPTPAISGLPKEVAAEFLLENEEWDRGLFSAPLLFQEPGRELALVAIRSGLLTAKRLHLFAGAGFVRGSTADSEWDETEKKLQVMHTVLFGETHGK